MLPTDIQTSASSPGSWRYRPKSSFIRGYRHTSPFIPQSTRNISISRHTRQPLTLNEGNLYVFTLLDRWQECVCLPSYKPELTTRLYMKREDYEIVKGLSKHRPSRGGFLMTFNTFLGPSADLGSPDFTPPGLQRASTSPRPTDAHQCAGI